MLHRQRPAPTHLELTQTVEALRHREKQLRKLSDNLRQALDERRELLNRIVSAQESERQRIARELHDHLGQYFAAMLLGLNAAERHQAGHKRARYSRFEEYDFGDEPGGSPTFMGAKADGARRPWSRSCDRQLPREMEWAFQSECGFCGQSSGEAIISSRRDHAISGAARSDDQYREACARRKNKCRSRGQNERGTPYRGR